MPEYLAPGVYVEEVSYRSKSIEGVSTTTTGFVGPARYGPTETEPDVLTSLLDFERVYGDRQQLVWVDGQYHNYLWHAVRAFFEEGGKRLYVARVFRPLTGEDGDTETAVYEPPKPSLKEDRVTCSDSKLYEQDGHARLWLTKETAAIRAISRELQQVLDSLDATQGQAALTKQRAENAARMMREPGGVGDVHATLRSAEKAQKSFSEVRKGFGKVQGNAAVAGAALPAGKLPSALLDASSNSSKAVDEAQKAVDEAVLRAAGAVTPATPAEAASAAGTAAAKLKDLTKMVGGTSIFANAVDKATYAYTMSSEPPSQEGVFWKAKSAVAAVQAAITAAIDLANTAETKAETAGTDYVGTATTMAANAYTAEAAAIALETSVNAVVAAAATALDKVRAAETQIKAASGAVDQIGAAVTSSEAAGVLLNSAREAAAAAQEFRAKASGALARAQVAQDLMSKLEAAVAAVNKADRALSRPADATSGDPGGVTVQVQAAQDAVDAVTAPDDPTPSPEVAEAVGQWKSTVSQATEEAQGLLPAVMNAAGTAHSCVTEANRAVAAAKRALDTQAIDKERLVQEAKDKVIAAVAALNDLANETEAAESKWVPLSSLASTLAQDLGDPIPDITSDAQAAVADAATATADAKSDVDTAFILFQDLLTLVNSLPESFTTAAVEAAASAAGGAVLKLEELEKVLRRTAKTIQDTETQLADTVAAYAGAAVDDELPEEPHEPILLRARFPGAYGNLPIRFSLRLGDNLLRGKSGKAKATGLQDGDFVWIGDQAASGATVESGELLLATLDEQTKQWRFGPDANEANLRYWLNGDGENPDVRLDPEKQFLRVATIAVTVLSGDGLPETWEGLALQPTHTRAGAPDSLTTKFSPEPASAADARMLPIVVLADDSLATAGALFKTLFSRLDTTIELPLGQDKLDVDITLVGGNDGQRPGASEYEGREKEHGKTGLKALEDLDDIAIVAAPGSTYGLNDGYRSNAESILGLTISHAERMRYRIAVLDSGNNQTIGEVRATCAKLDSKYAALYYPWVKVLDPVTRKEIFLPPSGFVTGIYARNDITRAVYKAPANEVVNLALGFEITLNKSQQDVLNPLGINCFRYFPGRGYRLWGARTLSSDPEWKYVNLRRYFAYVEHSVDKSTQWAVFEPNGERLWDNVRRTIYDFLLNEWQNGALLGEKPEKAFFVRCDRSTMTQNDMDNGRLVCMIGIAPLRPAEYVIFRIGQWTADRKV